jgi:hypothetical protein
MSGFAHDCVVMRQRDLDETIRVLGPSRTWLYNDSHTAEVLRRAPTDHTFWALEHAVNRHSALGRATIQLVAERIATALDDSLRPVWTAALAKSATTSADLQVIHETISSRVPSSVYVLAFARHRAVTLELLRGMEASDVSNLALVGFYSSGLLTLGDLPDSRFPSVTRCWLQAALLCQGLPKSSRIWWSSTSLPGQFSATMTRMQAQVETHGDDYCVLGTALATCKSVVPLSVFSIVDDLALKLDRYQAKVAVKMLQYMGPSDAVAAAACL